MFVFVFLLLIAGGAVFIVGWSASGRAIHPPQNVYQWSLSDFPHLKPETVTFSSRDGVPLSGRFFPGSHPATVVLSHGYGDNKDQMIPWADFLHQAGFSVFTYDMRDRGQSGGSAVTLGAKEKTDLLSVIDYLVSRGDVDRDRIGAFGVSLGASVTILAAAEDSRIKAVVDDSGFSTASNVIASSFHKFVHLPSFPFAPVTVKLAEWRTGASVHDVRPAAVISRISPRPIFIIHGTHDSLVPPENARKNFAAAGRPKEIWWVAGADHVESGRVEPLEYRRRIAAFFQQALDVPADSGRPAESKVRP